MSYYTIHSFPPSKQASESCSHLSAACCFARLPPACKYMHVAAPSLLHRHSFVLLAALAAITGMTQPNVARRSADHDENLPARSLPQTHRGKYQKTKKTKTTSAAINYKGEQEQRSREPSVQTGSSAYKTHIIALIFEFHCVIGCRFRDPVLTSEVDLT